MEAWSTESLSELLHGERERSFRFYTNYGCQTGSKIPRYTNLLLQHGTVLPSTAPYPTGKSARLPSRASLGHLMGLQLDNITIDGTIQGIVAAVQHHQGPVRDASTSGLGLCRRESLCLS
jgi:hypothetical protein